MLDISPEVMSKYLWDCFFFSFRAQKSFKYGCGLISAAEKGRRSFQLDSDASSALLSSHTSSWERLLLGATEVGDRLKMARHFHCLSEEVSIIKQKRVCRL